MKHRSRSSSKGQRVPIPPVVYVVVLILVTLAVYFSGNLNADATAPVLPISTVVQPADSPFLVLFTDPLGSGASRRTGGIDEAIIAALDAAQETIDIAIYNFSLQNVADALLRAQARGVRVRVVMESDSIDGRIPQYLMENDIQIFGDRKESLMHNKFIVIDENEVWVGSLNLTSSGVYSDHNHMVRLYSDRVAQNYTTEFEEMFIDDRFGAGSPANTPFPEATVGGHWVEVFFSPDDGVAKRLVTLVESASESVYFLAFSFTSDDIGNAVLARAAHGVEVRGVFDESQRYSNTGTEWDRFQAAGLGVLLDGNQGQMHHKVIIVDRRTVAFGSYNFSANAERRNDENIMIVHDPALAGQFVAEFERIYANGKRE
jgi:phosphatidylserine/phosphatidylglycerophosphate/cardiolipin synthase-like enzyme